MRRWMGVVLGLFVAIVAGCASSYSKLVPEDSLADLRAAKHATLSRPTKIVMAQTRGVDGTEARLAVHELQGGQEDRLLVFIHGVFADSDTWRFVAGNLARDHAVWLVDLPGCGQSESLSTSHPDSYTISDAAERTLQAVRQCLAGKPTPRIALVGHSYGAAVIIRMFSDAGLRERYADVVDQVDRLVLVSPLDIALNGPAPVYKQIAEASGFKVAAASLTGELKRRVAKATIASVVDPERALREEADKRIDILSDGNTRRALQQMIARAVPWTKALRPEWDQIEPMETSYGDVTRECLIMVGLRDEALPAAMSFKLSVQLPHTSLVPLRGVMHSPHIEAHERCATLIREFVTTGRVTGDVMRARGLATP